MTGRQYVKYIRRLEKVLIYQGANGLCCCWYLCKVSEVKRASGCFCRSTQGSSLRGCLGAMEAACYWVGVHKGPSDTKSSLLRGRHCQYKTLFNKAEEARRDIRQGY